MANRPRRKRGFFVRRKGFPGGNDYLDRPPRKKLPIGKMKQGIFILPSLLTLTGTFFSFYAIICAIHGRFVMSGALIIIAAFFDGIDGRVARLTKTTTRFGLELDSLADVISFGVAPAVLIYLWALSPYGRIGWVGAFVFVACGALRLARFNVQSGTIDSRRFNGLPIPAAAVMIATTVLFFDEIGLKAQDFMTPLLILTYFISFLMVSSVKFHAFKDLTLVKQKPFSSTVAFVLILALIAAAHKVVLFLFISVYVISGPALTLMLYIRGKKLVKETSPSEEAVEAKPT